MASLQTLNARFAKMHLKNPQTLKMSRSTKLFTGMVLGVQRRRNSLPCLSGWCGYCWESWTSFCHKLMLLASFFWYQHPPFRFFWSPWIQNKGWIIKYFELWPCCKVCLAHCVPAVWHSPPRLVYPVRVPYLSHSGLLLAAGKRETHFHSAVQLLVEYVSQVAYLLPFNSEANDYVGAVTFGLRQDCHFVLATD